MKLIKLRDLRKKYNLSQSDLAKILNLSQNAISRYEKGEADPDLETLKKISQFFKVSIDYLLDNEIKNNLDQISITQLLESKEKEELIDNIVLFSKNLSK